MAERGAKGLKSLNKFLLFYILHVLVVGKQVILSTMVISNPD